MLSDAQIMAGVPDFFSIESMLKATPAMESGERFIYMEASNEHRDLQQERVLAKALEESAGYYTKFGNVDIDHYSLLGKPNPKMGYPGIPSPELYEIGRPVQVRVDGSRTFVKAQLYAGTAETAKNANMVWDSMTRQNPPARWYPSVGGVPLAKSVQIDPNSGERTAVVERVRWTNIGLSRTPVNDSVPVAQAIPFGILAKSLLPGGGFFFHKGLEAGYGTDSATLTGGAALRKQSLHGAGGNTPHPIVRYFDLRERLAGAVRSGEVSEKPSAKDMVSYCAEKFGLSLDEAAEYVERFMRDLKQKRSM